MNDSPETPLSDLVVNDRFWLLMARKQLERSLDTKSSASQTLIKGVSWFWTAYTSAVLVGISIADFDLPAWRAVVVALPVVLLIGAYLTALWASQPVVSSFDPRDPAAVEAAYTESILRSAKRLRVASAFVAVAALSVAAAVVVIATAAS